MTTDIAISFLKAHQSAPPRSLSLSVSPSERCLAADWGQAPTPSRACTLARYVHGVSPRCCLRDPGGPGQLVGSPHHRPSPPRTAASRG
eukprot:COSAG03_NODE_1957_length_3301_cov_12.017489_3_plen_89_part_00